MNMNKALYWIALAAVAFGLSSEYHRGALPCLHSLISRARSHVSLLTDQAENAVLEASVLAGRWQLSSDKQSVAVQAQLEREVARHQADIDRAVAEHQADIDRAVAERQVELARAQARLERAQEALQRAGLRRMQIFETTDFKIMKGTNHRVITICPQTARRIRVEAGPEFAGVETDLPAVGAQF